MIHTKIYSVFPGVGKTFFTKKHRDKAIDIDSSDFDKPDFPDNYFNYITSKIGKKEIILISCHLEIIKKLQEEGIAFTLIYPNLNLKDEYLKRYKKRNDVRGFIDSLSKNWESLITNLEKQKNLSPIILKKGEYLDDVIKLS